MFWNKKKGTPVWEFLQWGAALLNLGKAVQKFAGPKVWAQQTVAATQQPQSGPQPTPQQAVNDCYYPVGSNNFATRYPIDPSKSKSGRKSQ